MNRRKLEQHLRRHNCILYAHGGGHDKWRRADIERGTIVPRHNEIKELQKPYAVTSEFQFLHGNDRF